MEFVKWVLAQPLRDRGVAATPVSMDGDVTSDRMARALATLYRSFDCVTSFVDFYAFRDKGERLRVTTDPAYYEEHAESVELRSPGTRSSRRRNPWCKRRKTTFR